MKPINTAPLKLDLYKAIDKMDAKNEKALHDFVVNARSKESYDLTDEIIHPKYNFIFAK